MKKNKKNSSRLNLKINKPVKYLWRLLFIALALFPIIFHSDFIRAFETYFTGGNIFMTIKNQWHIVILNIVFFVSFLVPLSYRRKIRWTEYGLVTAFFVSLFVEMYGIPLTVLLASKAFRPETTLPASVVYFHFLGASMSMHIPMAYGAVLITLGTASIVIGWITLYKNLKKAELVTSGIYSYSRHPQYLGFIMVIIGWLLGWNTILTAIMSPILIYKYLRVCIVEEREMAAESKIYAEYKSTVPFFF